MNILRIYLTLCSLLLLAFSTCVSAIAQELPTRGRIAFASDQDGDFEIYTINADGSGLQQLTFNRTQENMPVWSPDGRHILFTGERAGLAGIFVMNPDGSGQTHLTPGLSAYAGCWSPDGTKIAFTVQTNTSSQDIYVMNADGSQQANLTHDPVHINAMPVWSIDGKSLYFLSDRAYPHAMATDPSPLGVYAMNIDGSNPIFMFAAGIGITSLDVSPDGRSMIFGVWRLGPTLVLEDLRTLHQTVLIDGIETSGAYPAWSPDGKQIVYVSDGTRLAVMDANGTNSTILFAADASWQLQNPDWEPEPTATP